MTVSEFTNLDVATRLKMARKKKGCSVKEVAESIGVSPSTIQMYECGQRIPRDAIKSELSRFYGISIQRLFF